MTETTIGEVCLEAKAAYPGSIRYGEWVIQYIGSWDVSKIVKELEESGVLRPEE